MSTAIALPGVSETSTFSATAGDANKVLIYSLITVSYNKLHTVMSSVSVFLGCSYVQG